MNRNIFGITTSCIITVTICCHLNTLAQDSIVIGNRFKIESQILKEERQYLVYLPDSYENDNFYIQKKYPVLFLLDGESHFHLMSGIVSKMSAAENECIPEMIIVGVANTNRTRDFTTDKNNESAGSHAFLQFLEKELLSQIDKQFRTMPYRVLVGHSLAGLFVIESFLKQSVFNSYITIDPSLWWDNAALVKSQGTQLKKPRSTRTSLFITQANNPFNEGIDVDAKGKAIQSFVAGLEMHKPHGLIYKHVFFSEEDHFSVPLPSFYQGLSFIFEGYKFPLNTLKNSSAKDIHNHYKLLSDKIGTNLLPPGKLLNQVGLFLLSNQRHDEAIEIFKLNQEYYPNSYISYESLGDAYKRKGDKKLAIANYKKSLELNKDNEAARKSLAELGN